MRSRSSSGPACTLGLAGLALCLVALAPAQPGDTTQIPPREGWGSSFGGERVFAKPKQDAALGFTLSTQVMEVGVHVGDRVAAGTLLVRGDDREEIARYAQQVHRADSELQIERAQAAADLAQVEYEQNVQAIAGGGSSQLEVDRSRLAMVTARIDVQIAQWSQQQERYLAELTKARVDRFRLVASFDGVVDLVSVDLGDVVRETDPVVRVVDLSELWLDVPTLPETVIGLGLVPGSPAWVLIELGERPIVVRGRVINVPPTTDVAGKYMLRVAVTNGGEWPSGLDAWVRFTEPAEPWLGLVDAKIDAAGGQGALGTGGQEAAASPDPGTIDSASALEAAAPESAARVPAGEAPEAGR